MRRAVVIAGAAVLMFLAGCGTGQDSDTASGPVSAPRELVPVRDGVFLNQDPDVDYVGMETCRRCHIDIYSTYKQTGMGRSFYPMTAEAVVEDFSENNTIEVPGSKLRYQMIERDGKYYQRQLIHDSKKQERAVNERELVYIVGSNNHNRTYVVEQNGKLFQAPVCWYPQTESWELCPGFEHRNDHFGREISGTCSYCHNGVMQLVEGQRNQYHDPIPHGIGCERCHGPGGLHAARWSSGDDTPTGGADPTIVHPRRLTAERRLHLCSQCHLADAQSTERVGRHGTDLRDFRPGRPVTDVMVPFRYKQQIAYDFSLSSQVDRLMLSRCFTESDGELECLTCHNPHITVYSEDQPEDLFRGKCLGCHQVGDCTGSQGARRQTDPEDNCVACHMRRAEPEDLKFSEFTDHWIRRDIDLAVRDHRTDFSLEPIFPELFAELSAGEQAFHRGRANLLLGSEADPSTRRKMWDLAAVEFQSAIDAGFDNAEAWFFLGKMQLAQRKVEEALDSLTESVRRNPNHHDAAFALGQTLNGLGQLEAAQVVFREMLERNDSDPMALSELGRSAFGLGRIDEALAAFERAVAIEPWRADLRLNLGTTLAAAGRFEEAAAQGREAVRIDPESPPAWEFYENSSKAAGDDETALEAKRIRRRLAPG